MMSESGKKRFIIVYAILIVLVLLILARYAWLMLGPKPMDDPLVTPAIPVERGTILDRNGQIIAIQTQLFSVSAWIPQVSEPEETSALLSRILDIDGRELYKQLTSNEGSRFIYIKRKISPTETDQIKEIMAQGKFKGIGLHPEPGRSYPEKNIISHVVGYVGMDNIGLDGLEYTFNQILAPPVTPDNRSPVLGNQVYLTIDLNTQYLVREIAMDAFETNKPDNIMILVMDAKTGDLLSYVSLPDYDPNNYQKYSAAEKTDNPAVFTYEPGSVFKIFSISSILELGGISVEDTFDTTNGYNPEIFKKYDIPPITDLGRYGVIDTGQILMYSSNVGSAFASETVTKEDFYRKLREFGFGKQTALPLPGESNGILNPPDKWSIRTKPTIAIGQEIGVSAVQMISAATVFTNSGILLQPHIVRKITGPDGGILKEYKREPVRTVTSPYVAEQILLMMEQGVSSPYGTVRRAQIPGLRISAKSGTAQVADPVTGQYSNEKFVASVMGIFPTDNPKLIIYVVFSTPKGDSYYGGRIAAPVLKELILTLAPYYNIPIEGNTVVTHSGQVKLSIPEPLIPGDSVPDFTGYPKRSVLSYFQNTDLRFVCEGEGWVVRQSPPPGTPVAPGMTIYLEFK